MIGFSGADLLSDLVNLGSLGWPRRGLSHVAIVAHHGIDGLSVYESTTGVPYPCQERLGYVNGMQCHPIGRRLATYAGRAWLYSLRRPLEPDESDVLEIRLRRLCREERPYDYLGALGARSTLVAMAHRAKFGREDLSELFCSELVAAMWSGLAVLKTRNASAWSPNALARYAVRHGLVEEPVELRTGYAIAQQAEPATRSDRGSVDMTSADPT